MANYYKPDVLKEMCNKAIAYYQNKDVEVNAAIASEREEIMLDKEIMIAKFRADVDEAHRIVFIKERKKQFAEEYEKQKLEWLRKNQIKTKKWSWKKFKFVDICAYPEYTLSVAKNIWKGVCWQGPYISTYSLYFAIRPYKPELPWQYVVNEPYLPSRYRALGSTTIEVYKGIALVVQLPTLSSEFSSKAYICKDILQSISDNEEYITVDIETAKIIIDGNKENNNVQGEHYV